MRVGFITCLIFPCPDRSDERQVKMSNKKEQTGGLSKLAKTDDEIIFTDINGEKYSPLEWLQDSARAFLEVADAWDEYNPNFIKEEFKYFKKRHPKLSKIEAYHNFTHPDICQDFWATYIPFRNTEGITNIISELKPNEENIFKAFKNTAIFPNLLNIIGIIDFVIGQASSYYNFFWDCQLYQIGGLSEEKIRESFGEYAAEKYSLCRFKKLKIVDYEESFDTITCFLKKMQEWRYAEKLRDLSLTINGYCKLKNKKYSEIQNQIAKRYEIAYQSFQYAEEKTGKSLTDRQAYDYLKRNATENIEGFILPEFYTWQRYVRGGRRHHGTPKNTFRAGRAFRSAVKINEVDIGQITNQLNNSTDTD
jgi:hypothetical protein